MAADAASKMSFVLDLDLGLSVDNASV